MQKALQADQTVLCQVEAPDIAQHLDDYLWRQERSSFIPHAIGPESWPIAISADPLPGEHHQLLINLQPDIPTWFSRFERVIEIIYTDPDYQQSKRNNFRFYKERGYALDFFDLSDKFTGSKT